MVDELKEFKILNKKFTFVKRTLDKLIYQSNDKELGEFSVLELLISEKEEKIEKVNIYTFIDSIPLETLHILRGIDSFIEVDYYHSDYTNIVINNESNLYNVNIHQLYSEKDNEVFLENFILSLLKKGHKKHKTYIKIPLQENYYNSMDNRILHITSASINRMKMQTQFLIPTMKNIEKQLFKIPICNEVENSSDEQECTLLDIDIYPKDIYIYDRIYKLLGKKGEAIVYQNDEDDILEYEIYLSDDSNSIKELRLIEYMNSFIEGIKVKSKKQIIRFIVNGENIKATLCNHKKEDAIINGHTAEKAKITASALVNEHGKSIKFDSVINSLLGNYNLSKVQNNSVEYIDKNGDTYLINSKSIMKFKVLLPYIPSIIRNLEKKLLLKDSDIKVKQLKK